MENFFIAFKLATDDLSSRKKNWIPNLEFSIDEINETHEVGEEHCLNVVLKESPGQKAEGKEKKLLVLFHNYISPLDLNIETLRVMSISQIRTSEK